VFGARLDQTSADLFNFCRGKRCRRGDLFKNLFNICRNPR
jgi:hypothetical protein